MSMQRVGRLEDDVAAKADHVMTLSPKQVREARQLLNWSQEDFAESVGISRGCLRRFEQKRYTPNVTLLDRMRSALESAGVEFVSENGGRPRVTAGEPTTPDTQVHRS
jgi:ribosome-binding protein aMBF1 (putative translation factor)